MRSHRQRNRGFTILELMIAVAIIGVLAAVAIPSYRTYQFKSKRSEAYVNLGALARTQTAYFGLAGTFFGVAPAEPGLTNGDVPGTTTRPSAAIDTAFGPVGFAAEGQVYFDYDTNTGGLGAGCGCVQCFTSTAYGDIDGANGQSAIMFVHPDSTGATCPSAMFGYGTPLDDALNPIFDQVAINRAQDVF